MKRMFLFILLSLMLQCVLINAQDARYRFIGHKDGLSDNKIQSILIDSIGTCWVGTSKGLNRIYEGHIANYDHDPRIFNKEIVFMARDRKENIWMSAHGLFLYDYATDTFVEQYIDGEKIRPEWYSETEEGMFFCSNAGISRYTYSARTHETVIPRIWKEPRYNGFCMDTDTTAFVSSIDGTVYRINMNTRERSEIYRFDETISVKDVISDRQGSVWFAIYRKGLFCFSAERLEKEFRHGKSFFGEHIILDINEHDGKLYIATDGGGIYIMDLGTHETSRLQDLSLPELPEEMNSVNHMEFRGDELILGTIRHGIAFSGNRRIDNLDGNIFGSYTENGPNRSIVNSLAEDMHGKIWVGTDGGGLHRYDPATGCMQQIDGFERAKVVSIEAIDEMQMLISVYNEGIFRYDITTGKKKHIPIIDMNVNDRTLAEDIIIGLERMTDGNIMILAKDIYIYDSGKGIIRNSGMNLPRVHNIRLAHADRQSTILYTSYEVFRIDNLTHESEILFHDPYGEINCIKAIDGKLYIIWAYSLACMDLDKTHMTRLPFRYNGHLLPVLEEDGKGNIWTATRENVICIRNRNPETYTKYGSEESLVSNDFMEGVSLAAGEHIYLGGNSGLCIVDTTYEGKSAPQRKIHLIRANVDNRNIRTDRTSQNSTVCMTIPWYYESMSIDISTDGHDAFTKNRFRYTINDSDRQTHIYSDCRLSLPTLAPGTYEIDVAYEDHSDNWISSGSIISITVTPPWWKSDTFILATIVFVFVLTFSMTYIYHRREKAKARVTFRKRSEELAENQTKFLTDIANEMKVPTSMIYVPLKKLLAKNDFDENTRKELDKILKQSKHMNQFISTALDSKDENISESSFMSRLDKYIDDNLADDKLNAGRIIDHMCIGRASFYKKVKETTGFGIMEYVTMKRMTKAAELLKNTQLPVSTVANRSGYPDNQYFSKVFKQHFNMSPSSYRNQSSPADEP